MSPLYILQVMSTAVELPELDLHNAVNTGGIAFLIWYLRGHFKGVETMKADIHSIFIRLTKIETKDEVRNENKE